MPQGHYVLPSWSLADWTSGVRNFKERTATGPDGWARIDVAMLPEHAVGDLFMLLEGIEHGIDWPLQWQTALVRCLEKAPNSIACGQGIDRGSFWHTCPDLAMSSNVDMRMAVRPVISGIMCKH